jgi:NodT family efflux transporter outer membrane factor (OMF) lipoprotein
LDFKKLKLVCTMFIMGGTLAGCMMGPNFHVPAPPTTATYTRTILPPQTTHVSGAGNAGKAQYFINNQDIPAEWWTLYHSTALNHLITMGLANSPSFAAAKATLLQAQENLNAQIGTLLLPRVNAVANGQRQKFAGASIGNDVPSSLFNLYNVGVAVSYTFDLFGSSRRQIEASRAQVDFRYYQLQAAYLSLTANIVTTAITTASLKAQINAIHQLIAEEKNQLAINIQQFKLGSVSEANVFAQQTQLEQTSALLPPLEQNLSRAEHALSVLVGSLPSESQLPSIDLNKLNLPTRLPVSLPSALVRQRPDIQAAEALLHQANAQVGVATANLFPQITLGTTNYGWSSPTVNDLFHPATLTWSIGGQILQPIFQGGALRAQKRAAMAAYEQVWAQYRQTVLQAFQNVADSLRALESDARELKAQKRAEIAAYAALKLTKAQYRLGSIDYLPVLTAEQQYQQALINRIQAQAARYSDTAALFQALGGGWWHTTEGETR